jgi:hypothetical protein
MRPSSQGENVLYARCAFCGYTAALNCSGQFMPHPTMLVSLTAMGPTCPACGPLPPVFTCPYYHTQYLYIPGVSPMPQQGYTYAAVAQVQPGASSQSIQDAIKEVVGHVGERIGEGAVDAMFGQFQ